MVNLSTLDRLGIFAAIAIVAAATLSLFTPTPLLTLSLGFMVTGIIFILLGLVFGFESFIHRDVSRESLHFTESQRAAAEKHEKLAHKRYSKGDTKTLGLIFLFGIAFMIASVVTYFLFLL